MAQVFSGFAPTVQEKVILIADHIIMRYLWKQHSTTLWFTWYAVNIYQCRDVARGGVWGWQVGRPPQTLLFRFKKNIVYKWKNFLNNEETKFARQVAKVDLV